MKKAPIKSFAEMAKASSFTPPVPEWVEWAPQNMTKQILSDAVRTLNQSLEARLADLVRERVNLEDVQVVHHCNRTLIRVNGVDRFEFKLKITMGGT